MMASLYTKYIYDGAPEAVMLILDLGRELRVEWGEYNLTIVKKGGAIKKGGLNTFPTRVTMMEAAKAYMKHIKSQKALTNA